MSLRDTVTLGGAVVGSIVLNMRFLLVLLGCSFVLRSAVSVVFVR